MSQHMNTNSLVLILAAMVACIILPGNIQGQRPLDIDEIQVIAPYEPSISDAFKINMNPSIEDTARVQIDFDYRISPRMIHTRYELEPITPARMRGEPLTRLYPGLVKGGFGNYQTPYFEGFYNSLRSGDYSYGIHLRHISSGEEVQGIPHSVFSQNKAGLHATRYYGHHALSGGILYNRHVVHYYGLPFPPGDAGNDPKNPMPVIPPSASDIRQRYELLSSHLAHGSHHSDSTSIVHEIRLRHHWLSDRYNSHEHQFELTGHIGRETGMDPFGLARKQYLELGLEASHYYNRHVLDTAHTGVYTLSPRVHSYFDRLTFYLGGHVAFENDQGDFSLRAHPLAGVKVDVLPERLTATLDISGGVERVSWKSLSDLNPFVMPAPPLAFSNVRSRISGGVHGSLNGRLSYHLHLNHSQVDNHPFFVRVLAHDGHLVGYPGLSWLYPFVVVYDDISIMHAQAQLSSRWGQRFKLRLRGDWYDYSMGEQERAWHQPGLLLSLNASYNIQDKIILTADLYGRGKSYGAVYESFVIPVAPQQHKLHDFYVDANLGIEYRYTKRLSVFLNFTNIANDPYEKWLHYPQQGFGFMGGASFAF